MALQQAANLFYNYTQKPGCLNLSESDAGGLDASGWDVLACNEMVMPFGSTGTTDMFLPDSWDAPSYT